MKSNPTEDLTIRGIPREPLALFHLIPIVVLVSAQTRSTPYTHPQAQHRHSSDLKSSAHTLSAARSSRPPDMHWVVLPIPTPHSSAQFLRSEIPHPMREATMESRERGEINARGEDRTYLH